MASPLSSKKSELRPLTYRPLPLGQVRPAGWLRDQLLIQAAGLSGHLDEFWEHLADSAWIGGKGEGWERGPYWLDGIVPLAILLDHPLLKQKAVRWIDCILSRQHDDGWLGPTRNDVPVGSQLAYDPWPIFVLFKVFTQWAEATGDARIAPAMVKFFRRLDTLLDEKPLSEWSRPRWAELVLSIHWLYDRIGEPWLLALSEKLHRQGIDWTRYASEFPFKRKIEQSDIAAFKATAHGQWSNDQFLTSHGVNVAMGLKSPAIWYRQSGNAEDLAAASMLLAKLDEFHGQATGLFTCDEHLAGRMPSQGTELCTVVETMFSLETLLAIGGDLAFADRLERVAFNALPATFSTDMWTHQYDQQCNQVVCRLSPERIYSNNGPDANLFGLEPHFGCCTANAHQGWPKFAAHLWMSAADGGLACLAYAPCTINTIIDDRPVSLDVRTEYPFGDTVTVSIDVDEPAEFPLHFRIPGWAERAEVRINSGPAESPQAGTMWRVERKWSAGDTVWLRFDRRPRLSRGFNNAVSIHYGPLILALSIDAEWRKLRGEFPRADFELHPRTAWNYALSIDPANPGTSIEIERRAIGPFPFSPNAAPLLAKVRGRKLPAWTIDRNAAAAPPPSPAATSEPVEELTLSPYGCTHLRVTEFPLTD